MLAGFIPFAFFVHLLVVEFVIQILDKGLSWRAKRRPVVGGLLGRSDPN